MVAKSLWSEKVPSKSIYIFWRVRSTYYLDFRDLKLLERFNFISWQNSQKGQWKMMFFSIQKNLKGYNHIGSRNVIPEI